jgi:hypothetical protein
MGLLKCVVGLTEQKPLVLYCSPTQAVVDAATAMKTLGVKVHPMGHRVEEGEVDLHHEHLREVEDHMFDSWIFQSPLHSAPGW